MSNSFRSSPSKGYVDRQDAAERTYVHASFLPLSGGTITGGLTASGGFTTEIGVSSVQFTTEVITSSATTTSDYLKVVINGVDRYLNIYDIG